MVLFITRNSRKPHVVPPINFNLDINRKERIMDKNNITALSVLVQAGIPVMLVSPPGRAKSSIVDAIGTKLDLPVHTYLLSLREPTDLIGFPAREGETTKHLPPAEFVNLALKGKGILFLDELTTAPPSIQKVALRMVEERWVGEIHLPAGISIVAAGNPPDQAVDGYDLGLALANRFIFLEWPLNMGQWTNYMLTGDRGTLPNLPEVPACWRENVHKWRAKVLGFVQARRNLVESIPQDETTLAFPTPRSWDKAAQGMAAAQSAGCSEEVVQLILAGAVGKGAALEFINWVNESDLPNPEDLLKDPSKWKVPEDSSQTYAIMISLTAEITHNPTLPHWKSLWKIVKKISEAGQKDIAAVVVPQLSKIRANNDWEIPDEITELMSLIGGV
jgi:hypothetical protein